MKSYFLVDLESVPVAEEALRARLPGQEQPWVLRSPSGDPIAYFNVGDKLDGETVVHVQADVSGRHHNDDTAVLGVLRNLQASIGGVVTGDA